MMDIELRLAAISKLVGVKSSAVDMRLREEFSRVESTLMRSSEYEELSDALKTLAVLAPRFHMALMPMLTNFVRSLRSRILTHGDFPVIQSITRYRSADDLISMGIDAARQIRYVHTEIFVEFLLEMSRRDGKEIQRKAEQALDEIAEFDLDVFYEQRQGAAVQARIVRHLAGLSDYDLLASTSPILRILGKLLSPSMEGHSWTYSSITIRRGAIVSGGGVAEMREAVIALLKRMYALDQSVDFRRNVLRAMDVATRRERAGDDFDTSKMLERDAISILHFRKTLVATEALPLVQMIEHQTYWNYHHAATKSIEIECLRIRDDLNSRAEYQMYKQLIGFEGIFGNWEELRRSESSWDYSDTKRRATARQYLNEIDDNSYAQWRDRIVEFSKTRSNDLATFPVFYEFLESVGRERPQLALELVTTHTETMAPFLTVLLRGLWSSRRKPDVQSTVERWIKDGVHLTSIVKSLYSVGDPLLHNLDAVISRSAELNDCNAILNAIGVAVSLHADGSVQAKDTFMRGLRELAKRGDPRWANAIWLSRDLQPLIDAMTADERIEALTSLASLPKLDFQAEEVLFAIAQWDIQSVLDYLMGRLKLARDRSRDDSNADVLLDDRFEAVPYQFLKLNGKLAEVPDKMLSALRHDFDEELQGLFAYRGARLIEATFPELVGPVKELLLDIIRRGNERDIDFVVGIIRAYEGSAAILDLCKEVIKAVPEGSRVWREVAAAIETTGVVSGEYGLAKAYEGKRNDIAGWQNDGDARVRAFAKRLMEDLEQMIEHEKRRADEDVALRRYKYGAAKDEDL